MKTAGIPVQQISDDTGPPERQVYYWNAEARRRGYDPTVSKILPDAYFTDKPKSGRPKKQGEKLDTGVLDAV